MRNIQEYRSRTLSFPSDSLNAISVLVAYERVGNPIHHVWSLPIAKSRKLRGLPHDPPPTLDKLTINQADGHSKKWIQRI
jgi:hypothetical protein